MAYKPYNFQFFSAPNLFWQLGVAFHHLGLDCPNDFVRCGPQRMGRVELGFQIRPIKIRPKKPKTPKMVSSEKETDVKYGLLLGYQC